MAPVISKKKEPCRGAWTAEEDQKIIQVIEIYGPKRWKFIAAKAGVNRSGKSCRLRWLNYLRPNIKRGNISDQEEDLILRLHKLLGNRWSLIARRLPGRTDNEIKNYWNSHLSKKMNLQKKDRDLKTESMAEISRTSEIDAVKNKDEGTSNIEEDLEFSFIQDEDLFPCGGYHGALDLEWMGKFLEMDQSNWFAFDLQNDIM